MVRAQATHLCGQGLNPSVDAIYGLSLSLVLSFSSRGFSLGTPVFPLSSETKIFKFQFDHEPLRGCATA